MPTATKAKSTAKKAASQAESIASNVVDDLQGRFAGLTGLSEKSFDEAVEMGEEVVVKVRDFVEQEPWKAVAIAGAIGLLIGLAARR